MTCENEGIVLALSWSEVLWAMLVNLSLKGVKIGYEPENFNNSEKKLAMVSPDFEMEISSTVTVC